MTTTLHQRPDLSTADSDELRAVDGYLLHQRRGTLTTEGRQHLDRLRRAIGISDAELQVRMNRVVARKAEELEAKQPKYTGKPLVVRVVPKEKQRRLISYFTEPHADCIGDYLNADRPSPVPDLYCVEWFGEDEATRDYLCSLIERIDSGELKPGCVATVSESRTRTIPNVAHFRLDALPLSLRIERYSFVRLPGQSQRELDKLVDRLKTEAERLDNGGMMPPTQRTAAGFGGRF